eukprot:11480885-Ditylum_brightwellii.AAC.1
MKQSKTQIIWKAQKKSLFGWYYVWLKLSDIVEQQQDIDAGMRQPDTIKVSCDQPDSNQTGGTRVLTVRDVPDKGIFGAEYSLIYTIEEFRKKIVPHLDPTAADLAETAGSVWPVFARSSGNQVDHCTGQVSSCHAH